MKSRKRAFTLIELLIVVAIIAILAAIAVPNFLEAQVRSKVARTMADMRSSATAIETYTVDYNRPPRGWQEARITECFAPYIPPFANEETDEEFIFAMKIWTQLTTPVSYLSSVPRMVFLKTPDRRFPQGQPFEFNSYVPLTTIGGQPYANQKYLTIMKRGYTWSLHCLGPAPERCGGIVKLLGGANSADCVNAVYDGTNGTISRGLIGTTSKGFYKGPQ